MFLGRSSKAVWPSGLLAICQGSWKLIPCLGQVSIFEGLGSRGGFTQPPSPVVPQPGGPQGQLYNLADDPGERKNVYSEHPEIVLQLTALLERYQREGSETSELSSEYRCESLVRKVIGEGIFSLSFLGCKMGRPPP